MEQLCVTSFLENGHPFHLYTYNDIKGVPDGAVMQDANSILPEESVFKYRDRDSYAGFSNLFRYKLLHEKGSFWVDMDIVCLEPFVFAEDYVFATFCNDISQPEITNFIIKSPANSELMKFCFLNALQFDQKNIVWGMTGPKFFAESVAKFSLEKYSVEPDVFSPVNWGTFNIILNDIWPGLGQKKIEKTRAIHLWNEMWRLNGIDKNAQFSKNCLYEQLKSVYNIF